ncbi:hypothetical protein GCM10009754_42980 [Amycolatopsis minnesotensis]|uniref:Uncharacterized protein n=1 Tax=Amycolatopsis minnesotensis TaxID=337894 RepID=A0ABN2RAL1_9PSEU
MEVRVDRLRPRVTEGDLDGRWTRARVSGDRVINSSGGHDRENPLAEGRFRAQPHGFCPSVAKRHNIGEILTL